MQARGKLAWKRDDFCGILAETEASLSKQYAALMKTEGVELTFTPDAVAALARSADLSRFIL